MKKRYVFICVVLISLAAIAFGSVKVFNLLDVRYPWIWAYMADQIFLPKNVPVIGPKHLMFIFVDHFEPHDQKTMNRWMVSYPKMAGKHHDSDGKYPQHSWFWYFAKSDEKESLSFLQQLSQLVYEGYGELDLHLHHHHNNEKTFLEKIGKAIQLSQETGAFVTAEPKPRTAFGFIHGMWSLDNSRGDGECGVNNELILLRKVGCYADFTHPSWGKMHPRTVNRLYYATDDPNKPKSYDFGPQLQARKAGVGDLLIFEGPSVVRFHGLKPSYDHGDITHEDLPTPERLDAWVKTEVHVEGRPEWVFVKVFTHGALAPDHDAVLGKWADKMHSYLEKNYNDGKDYVLHYVTAREAYNIAKAAESGGSGNPNEYRDFIIPRYVNRFFIASVPFETISVNEGKVVVRFLAKPGSFVKVQLRGSEVEVAGDAKFGSSKSTKVGTEVVLTTAGQGVVGFTFTSPEETL